jgi:Flp pilus assembly protein TadD
LKQQLVDRTEALAQVIQGLGQYQRGDFAAAAAAFRTAEQQRAWDGTQGKEVLYLFSGYSAARSGDVDSAHRYFSVAEIFPPTRARAKLGISEL